MHKAAGDVNADANQHPDTHFEAYATAGGKFTPLDLKVLQDGKGEMNRPELRLAYILLTGIRMSHHNLFDRLREEKK